MFDLFRDKVTKTADKMELESPSLPHNYMRHKAMRLESGTALLKPILRFPIWLSWKLRNELISQDPKCIATYRN